MSVVLGKFARRLRSLSRGQPGAGADLSSHERITLPSAAIYVYWDFTTSVAIMEWDLTVHIDPGASVGEYLALFNGSIDGAMCYLGLQTDMFHPEIGRGVGKGLIFSTWWSFDASDTRVAADGFRELGAHEGRFVGIRRPYQWGRGDYRVTLARSDSEVVRGRVTDWFDLSIQPLEGTEADFGRPAPSGPSEWIGALRFPRRFPDRAAAIEPGGLMFLEVYSGAQTWTDVVPWYVDVMAYGDSATCPSGRTEYPRPYGQHVPNVSARYDPRRARVDLRLGVEGGHKDPPGSWP